MCMDLTVNSHVINSNISLKGHLKNTPTLQKYLKELNSDDLILLRESLKIAAKVNDGIVFELCEKKEKQQVLKPLPKVGKVTTIFLKELSKGEILSSETIAEDNNLGKIFYYDNLRKVLLNPLSNYRNFLKSDFINKNIIDKFLV